MASSAQRCILRFPEDMRMQRCALDAMGSLVSINESNRKRLADAGAMEPILGLLRDPGDEWVLLTATHLFPDLVGRPLPKLLDLAEHNKQTFKVAAMEGTIDLLVDTMEKYPNELDVRITALGLIFNLASIGENTVRLGARGACELLVKIMWDFLQDYLVYTYQDGQVWLDKALDAVIALASNVDNRERLGAAGLCDVLRYPKIRDLHAAHRLDTERLIKAKEIIDCIYVPDGSNFCVDRNRDL
jgi:hypothetical protein